MCWYREHVNRASHKTKAIISGWHVRSIFTAFKRVIFLAFFLLSLDINDKQLGKWVANWLSFEDEEVYQVVAARERERVHTEQDEKCALVDKNHLQVEWDAEQNQQEWKALHLHFTVWYRVSWSQAHAVNNFHWFFLCCSVGYDTEDSLCYLFHILALCSAEVDNGNRRESSQQNKNIFFTFLESLAASLKFSVAQQQ